MIPFSPSLQMSSAASAALDARGATSSFGGGDWTVNVAGSGQAYQSASAAGGLPTWMIVGLIVGGAWLLLKR